MAGDPADGEGGVDLSPTDVSSSCGTSTPQSYEPARKFTVVDIASGAQPFDGARAHGDGQQRAACSRSMTG